MKDIISIAMGELTATFDNEVMKAVQKVGIDVDKEELVKALDLYHNLVRCGECKHWWNEYGDSACMLHSDFTVNADDFCSYGEREGE